LQADNESFFDVSLFITVYDEKGKNTNKKTVKRKLKELGFKFNEMFFRQQDAYFSSQIDEVDITKISRGIHSSSVSAGFPFISNAVMDKKGILLGENKMPVFLDFFERNETKVNSNMMIIGKSGSGKSFATKTILTNLASENNKIFILDPENEYDNLVKNLHGKMLDVSSSKDGRINPFHIITGIDDELLDGTSSAFFAHLQFLEDFFKLILQGINADSLELLNKLILDMYKSKKINSKTDLLKLKAKDYPIFDDLCFLIEENLNNEKDEYIKSCLKVLNNYLSKFKSGGRNSSLWNGATTFSPSENLICFNFQKLLANKNNVIANAQMLLVLKWIENEVIKNRDYNNKFNADRKIIVAIDEAHVFIDEKFPIALDFMYQLGKRIRKYNGMQIVITQNIKDFMGSVELARKSSAIINVSQYSLIFSLSPNDMSDLCTLYEKAGQINEVESENIVSLPRGCCFLITSPQNRTNIRIIASDYVRELFE
jgi:conjugal transfer ATP-binding protein TraC